MAPGVVLFAENNCLGVTKNHVREKHPKYFHEVRKWQLTFSFSLITESVLLMLGALYPDALVNLLTLTGALISLAFMLFSFFKLRSAAKKNNVPWKKTLPLN